MAERRRIGVGLVGAGFVARLHAEAYQHVRGVDVDLVAVTAARRERADVFAREFAVGRAVADFRAVSTTERWSWWISACPRICTRRWPSRPPARAST